MSEDPGGFLHCQKKYSKSLSWAKNLNKLFTVLGGEIQITAQDSDLEYFCWRCKNSPVSSDLKPPLTVSTFYSLILQCGPPLKAIPGFHQF